MLVASSQVFSPKKSQYDDGNLSMEQLRQRNIARNKQFLCQLFATTVPTTNQCLGNDDGQGDIEEEEEEEDIKNCIISINDNELMSNIQTIKEKLHFREHQIDDIQLYLGLDRKVS